MEKIDRRALLKGGLAMAVGGRTLAIGGALAGLADGETTWAEGADDDKSVQREIAKLDHERFMRLAIEQAKKVPSCPFGAVVINIKTKQVVANGWVRAQKNPIWHGEMSAMYNCPDSDKGFDWKEVCLYTTGESCPMCQGAIVWTGMPLVVYGSSIPFLQTCGFGQINIRSQVIVDASLLGKCKVIGGVLEKECNQLFLDSLKLRS